MNDAARCSSSMVRVARACVLLGIAWVASLSCATVEVAAPPAPAFSVPAEPSPPRPPPDIDNDGVAGETDVCPEAPEDCDRFQDEDGCPDPDDDRDNVPDVCDACPREAETPNGYQDDDGCADAPVRVIIQSAKKQTTVVRSSMRIVTRVFFMRGSARVRPASHGLFDEIAAVMRQNPQVELVATLGRAAPDERNVERLSLRRAEVVLAALVSRGVAASRLVAYGIGTRRPVGGVPDVERSVELVVMRLEGFDVYRWTGTDVESTAPIEAPRAPPPPRPACVPGPIPTRGHPCPRADSITGH